MAAMKNDSVESAPQKVSKYFAKKDIATPFFYRS